MQIAELQWLVGISLTVVLTIGGMLIAAFRALSGKIDKGNTDMAKALKDGDDHLHERVNRIRDEYVKRVDLDGHLGRIDATLREIREDQREMNRIVLAALPRAAARKTS